MPHLLEISRPTDQGLRAGPAALSSYLPPRRRASATLLACLRGRRLLHGRADRNRPYRRAGISLRSQRQDDGARQPHLVPSERSEIGILDLIDAKRQTFGRTRGRRRFALQETLGYGIGERIVEREQHDLFLRDVASCVIGETGTLGVIEFLRIGVFPIIAPAGVDVEHIAGDEAAVLQPLRL